MEGRPKWPQIVASLPLGLPRPKPQRAEPAVQKIRDLQLTKR
jgi:hypothetical protein